ncbi:AsnC family transcriptional regulator [Methylobacterium sp. C25]|nr:AsnC family transcriptional regulator [Methylobacterium sp. C25]MCE4222949.1 AsnC family transcriptional regulator [Methylobacterium sp. C25]
MQFEYTPRHSGRSPVTDAATFRVERLKRGAFDDASQADITHLIDRSYRYHSSQELRWHLAERLGTSPAAISLTETSRRGFNFSRRP